MAAAIAVFHDVIMTVGFLALSYYLVTWIPGLAEFLQINAFQINLTIVAALLTIIGYSLSDTIVLISGSPMWVSGTTNLIKVHRVGERR